MLKKNFVLKIYYGSQIPGTTEGFELRTSWILCKVQRKRKLKGAFIVYVSLQRFCELLFRFLTILPLPIIDFKHDLRLPTLPPDYSTEYSDCISIGATLVFFFFTEDKW